MSLPKTFTAGERLFAADLNSNFEHVEDAKNILVSSADDTGSPWNLPYPDGGSAGSLAKTIEDLAEATADGLDAAGNAGIGSNVVQTVKTDVFSTTSTSFTAVTGLTATITPTSDTAKVLVSVTLQGNVRNDEGRLGMRLLRGATPISVGNLEGSRAQTSATLSGGDSTGVQGSGTLTTVFVDAPAVDVATTYSVEIFASTGTVAVNTSAADNNVFSAGRSASSITLIEVAA